jgi:hypothetical protein
VSLANNTATHFMAQLLLLPALVTSYTPMWLALSRSLTQEVANWLRSSTCSLDMSPFSRSFENQQYSTCSKVFIVGLNVSIQLQSRLSTQTTGVVRTSCHICFTTWHFRTRSALYTPQFNGIAERQNRSIFEMARTTLTASGLPPTYWVESVKNAVYIGNRLPDSGEVSPFENLFGQVPSISKLCPFGCLSFMLLD